MKKLLFVFSFSLLFLSCNKNKNNIDEIAKLKKQHQKFLDNSPFNKTLQLSIEERKKLGIPPNSYLERQWELTMNPELGRPTPEKLNALAIQLKKLYEQRRIVPGGTNNAWEERGPNNVGGRTKALLFDPNDTTGKRVFAGSISGGLWYNDDITNAGSPWHLTNMPENMNVSSITVDPANPQIFYVGTGESYTGGDANGNGIWKSTDGGYNWQHIFGGQDGVAQFVTNANLNISSPSSLQGDYNAVQADFGLNLINPVSGELVLVDDGSSSPLEGCNSLTNSSQINGKIAVIMRGTCYFVDKVRNAENAGAIAVIMINNVSGNPIIMGGNATDILIPSVMISNNDGQNIINALQNNQTVSATISATGSEIAAGYFVPGITQVNDIITRRYNDITEIYAAVGDGYYSDASSFTILGHGYQGLYKSVDQGATWTQVNLPLTPDNKKYIPFDLDLGADNSIWLSTTRSVNRDHNYGAVFKSMDGNNFIIKYSADNKARMNISVSKQTPDKVYLVYVSTSDYLPYILKTTNGFNSTTTLNKPNGDSTPANDFTNGQSFYDLAISVDPNNDQTVYIGGIDWFKSTNGGITWTQISSGYSINYSLIHPDQHGIAFNGSNEIVFGNDGGVCYSPDAGATIYETHTNYVTTQFYSVGVGPVSAFGGEYFMAGAQDNGTQLFENAQQGHNSSTEAQGGDGAACFFDQDGTDKYRISNYVYNASINLYNYQTNHSTTINSEYGRNGDFICQEALDSHKNILYTNYSSRSSSGNSYLIKRYSNLLGYINKHTISNPLMNSFPTALKVSPYTTNSSKLFVGLQTGKLLRIDNADTNPVFTDIGSTRFIGSISDIEFGANENIIFITFFNYGVINIYYTEDGGNTWVNKEGNLPDMPVNCILQNPLRPEEVIIGTDLGVWKTENFTATNPVWEHSYNGMNSVKVTDLDMRDDYKVYAATYGRGVFTGQFTAQSGIDDIKYSGNINIFPNPVNKNLHIKIDNIKDDAYIHIFDMSGKEILKQKFSNTININKLSKGNYIINVKEGKIIYQSKFIKI